MAALFHVPVLMQLPEQKSDNSGSCTCAWRFEDVEVQRAEMMRYGNLIRRLTMVSLAVLAAMLTCSSSPIKAQGQLELANSSSEKVDFSTEILPIFSSRCFSCHGPDEQASDFRLDVGEIALTGGDGHAPNIIPGNSAESNLIQFVSGKVQGMEMPPEGTRLTAQQIDRLRRWIDQGALWSDNQETSRTNGMDWWSLKPLVRNSVPDFQAGCRNEIDAFVRDKLVSVGLEPSPEADRQTLIRRVYFDLIGLPPTPEAVDAFVASQDPGAYERMVDQLLESPRYGERWARHWMDIAHFAETHGHDQDRIRENAWPYRDYLVESFNSDKPYHRFVQEQVAGDVLFPDDPQATVALGFLAAGPWDESSLRDIREDAIDRQIARYLDRDDIIANVMNNFVSATVQCARCHDHKFDPISQADYYSLQAVFSGVERANRVFDADSAVHQRRQTLQAESESLKKSAKTDGRQLLSSKTQDSIAAWQRELEQSQAAWEILIPENSISSDGATLVLQSDGSILSTGLNPDRDTYTITTRVPACEYQSLRLEVLSDDGLPSGGPGRQENGNLHLSEIELYAGEVDGERIPVAGATSDFGQTDWEITRAIDGNPQTAWGIFPKVGQSHQAVFEFRQSRQFDTNDKLTIVLKQHHGGHHLIGRLRLSISNSPPIDARILPQQIADLLAEPLERRTDEQRIALALYYRQSKIGSELSALPEPSYVFAVASDFEPDGGLKPPPGPRPVQVLKRGDIRQPLDEARPGSLSCVVGLSPRFVLIEDSHEAERRAALAQWLTADENVLTWRSIVNRVWSCHFGRGLVSTPNDFGRMGGLPSNPELLDWLAVSFRDSGQSIKQLHRLIVNSATYRQVSSRNETNSAAQATDSDNQYFWRMNRSRLDAECIRDTILVAAGRLDLRMGGPGDRQFDLKPGSHVTPVIDYSKFDLESPAGCRRSVYRFLFRTLPDPFMESLDCPAGDFISPMRENLVTVQQAMAMWNDAFVVCQSQHFANRLRSMGANTQVQIVAAFQLALSRTPNMDELREFGVFIEKHGLENFCRVMFNLNEFVFIN